MEATLNYTATTANPLSTLSGIGGLSNPSQLLGGGQAGGGTVAVTACAKSGNPGSTNTANINVLTGPYQGYSVSGPVQGNFTAARA